MIWVDTMNLQLNFSRSLCGIVLLAVASSGYSAVNSEAVLTVKGKVTRGTCAFTLSDQTVKFSKPILVENVVEIGEKDENKLPFTVEYNCQEFSDETPDMEVIIKAGAGTQITNDKISPVTNITNSSFALYDCKNSNCSVVNFNAGVSSVFIQTGNGTKNKDFQVEVVKKDTLTAKPGALKAILALTLVQP